jgi:SAM-dependent methyltransferase
VDLPTEICFRLVKPRVLARERSIVTKQETYSTKVADPEADFAGLNLATFTKHDYDLWRDDELRNQFLDHFNPDSVKGKNVLDFGCGSGRLSFLMVELGAKRVDALDLDPDNLERAARILATENLDLAYEPQFKLAANAKEIPYPDQSFDIILCFDVVEHIMKPDLILREWQRVLRPGGKVYVWWQPYYHPYGHHLLPYMPLPWAHVFFSKQTLAKTCMRVHNLPEYVPRYWDLDEKGKKREMQTPARAETLGGINCMSISSFEKRCRSAGLGITRKEPHAFGGSAAVTAVSRLCSKTPFLSEFFTAYLIYEIGRASDGTARGAGTETG